VLDEPGMSCQLYVCVNFVHYVMLLLANKMMMMMNSSSFIRPNARSRHLGTSEKN